MGSPKKVMCRETGEIMVINADTCPDWKTKYLHCSGVEFEVPAEDLKARIAELEAEAEKEEFEVCEEGCLEKIQAEYLEKIGNLPPRFKNDPVRLAKKLAEL